MAVSGDIRGRSGSGTDCAYAGKVSISGNAEKKALSAANPGTGPVNTLPKIVTTTRMIPDFILPKFPPAEEL
jgi:hypothetical protein